MSAAWVKPNVVSAACTPEAGSRKQIQILHGASRMTDLQFDTMASEYLGVSLRNVIVSGSCRPAADNKVTRRQRIEPSDRWRTKRQRLLPAQPAELTVSVLYRALLWQDASGSTGSRTKIRLGSRSGTCRRRRSLSWRLPLPSLCVSTLALLHPPPRSAARKVIDRHFTGARVLD